MTAPVDNLVRLRVDDGTIAVRANADDGRTLHGHFAVFNRWTEINSWYEGHFMERIQKGAFKRTLAERGDKIRVLYEHGHDPSIGNKPIATPNVIREDATGAYYEAELFDASYVNDLIPAISAGQMGASFRMKITGEEWIEPKKSTAYNPAKLPERTITDVDLFEFGPVTFGAYAEATSGVRSGTDDYIDRLLHDPLFVARLTERVGLNSVEKFLATLPADGRSTAPAPESTDGDDEARARKARAIARARAALL